MVGSFASLCRGGFFPVLPFFALLNYALVAWETNIFILGQTLICRIDFSSLVSSSSLSMHSAIEKQDNRLNALKCVWFMKAVSQSNRLLYDPSLPFELIQICNRNCTFDIFQHASHFKASHRETKTLDCIAWLSAALAIELRFPEQLRQTLLALSPRR